MFEQTYKNIDDVLWKAGFLGEAHDSGLDLVEVD